MVYRYEIIVDEMSDDTGVGCYARIRKRTIIRNDDDVRNEMWTTIAAGVGPTEDAAIYNAACQMVGKIGAESGG
jgi:hypothetical protein